MWRTLTDAQVEEISTRVCSRMCEADPSSWCWLVAEECLSASPEFTDTDEDLVAKRSFELMCEPRHQITEMCREEFERQYGARMRSLKIRRAIYGQDG